MASRERAAQDARHGLQRLRAGHVLAHRTVTRATQAHLGAIERAERTPSIVAADRLARALRTTPAGMFRELGRELDEPDQDKPLTNDLGPEGVFFLSASGLLLAVGVKPASASMVC